MDQVKNKGGRPKGSKNKAALILEQARAEIEARFGIINFHPVVGMLVLAADQTQDVTLRLNAMAKSAPFIMPTLKAVELTGENGGPVQHADVTEAAMEAARILKLEPEDLVTPADREVEDAEDEDEVIDPARQAAADALRAVHEAEAEEARIAREAAKAAAAKTKGRQAEDLSDVDEALLLVPGV